MILILFSAHRASPLWVLGMRSLRTKQHGFFGWLESGPPLFEVMKPVSDPSAMATSNAAAKLNMTKKSRVRRDKNPRKNTTSDEGRSGVTIRGFAKPARDSEVGFGEDTTPKCAGEWRVETGRGRRPTAVSSEQDDWDMKPAKRVVAALNSK